MTKTILTSRKPRRQHSPEFRSEALEPTKHIGVVAATREFSLYGSQLYNQHSKQRNQQAPSECELEMSTEIVRLKCQLAEQDEELAILQKAATYFMKHLKRSMSPLKDVRLSSTSRQCTAYSEWPAAVGIHGVNDGQG